MGYYTDYKLSFDTSIDKRQEVFDYINETFNQQFDSGYVNSKWYYHVPDMVEVSKKWPDVLFTLEGIGEESGDMWRKYFKNGKVQICPAVITYPQFDESEMEVYSDKKRRIS